MVNNTNLDYIAYLVCTGKKLSGNISKSEWRSYFDDLVKKSNEGNYKSSERLGKLYETGNEYLLKNIEKSNHYSTLSQEQYVQKASEGSSSEYYRLGVLYEDGSKGVDKDTTKAIEMYFKAAKENNVMALHKLGNIKYEQECYSQAVLYLKKASSLGHKESTRRLYTMYAQGRGVEKDKVMADKFYKKLYGSGARVE